MIVVHVMSYGLTRDNRIARFVRLRLNECYVHIRFHYQRFNSYPSISALYAYLDNNFAENPSIQFNE
jgi:hypothetical protein